MVRGSVEETSRRRVAVATNNPLELPQVYFVNQKKSGKEKLGKGKVSSFTVSRRLISDDEIDLRQVQQSL